MLRQFRAGERRIGCDQEHEPEPAAVGAATGVVPGEAIFAPAGGVGGQRKFHQRPQPIEALAQSLPIRFARRDEIGKLPHLPTPDGRLDVERLQVIAQMTVGIFVVVALGQLAQLPAETLVAGVVHSRPQSRKLSTRTESFMSRTILTAPPSPMVR